MPVYSCDILFRQASVTYCLPITSSEPPPACPHPSNSQIPKSYNYLTPNSQIIQSSYKQRAEETSHPSSLMSTSPLNVSCTVPSLPKGLVHAFPLGCQKAWSGWCSISTWSCTYIRGCVYVCPQVGLQGSPGPSDHTAKLPGSKVKAN